VFSEGQIEKNEKRKRNDVELSEWGKSVREIKQNLYQRQKILFGNEIPKREHYLSYKTQDKILEYYKNENSDFKKVSEIFKNNRKQMSKELLVII